jgi:hypothetical protein
VNDGLGHTVTLLNFILQQVDGGGVLMPNALLVARRGHRITSPTAAFGTKRQFAAVQ